MWSGSELKTHSILSGLFNFRSPLSYVSSGCSYESEFIGRINVGAKPEEREQKRTEEEDEKEKENENENENEKNG